MKSVTEAPLVMHAALLFTNNPALVLASLALLNSERATTSVSHLRCDMHEPPTNLL
jgi:hypothetical protein